MMLGLQAENRKSSVLALDWRRTTVANDNPAETDAPVSLLQPVPNKSQPMLFCPAASQQITSEAAQSPDAGAQSTAKLKASSCDVSYTAVSEAMPLQQPSTPTVVAVSMQDMPQLVHERFQHATANFDQPQSTTSRVNQPRPASKSAAANEEEERPPALAKEGTQSQAAAPNMHSRAAEVDQPQLSTAGWSQPQPAAAASEMNSLYATTISQADQPQLATPVEVRPQPAVPQILDLLFPPEQPQAPPGKSPSSSPADSPAVPESPVLHVHTGTADANTEDCCVF